MINFSEWFKNHQPQMLMVRVTTKAAGNNLKFEYDENGKMLIRAYLTLVPEGGKANKALLKLLAKELAIPVYSLKIVQGLKSRNKIIKVIS